MATSENEQDLMVNLPLISFYPAGFDAALLKLYERSFEECDMPEEIRTAILTTWHELGVFATDLLHDPLETEHFGRSLHTTEVCLAGRPDLTAESLALSEVWKIYFSSSAIEHIQTRQMVFSDFLSPQRISNPANAWDGSTDPKIEAAGFRTRKIGGKVYLISEDLPEPGKEWWLSIGDEFWCTQIAEREKRLAHVPFFSYHIGRQHHHLSCKSCATGAPTGLAISSSLATDQFRRAGQFLANLRQCLDFLDFSEVRIDALSPEFGTSGNRRISFLCRQRLPQNGNHRRLTATLRQSALWRAFVLANYLPYVCDMSIYCSFATIDKEHSANPWATLRAGHGYAEAVQFVQVLSNEHFETALLAHEIFSAINDSPDWFAFGSDEFPRALSIPSSNEGLQSIPGFLNVREGPGSENWTAFLGTTMAEDLPDWAFDVIDSVIKLALKAAKLALNNSVNESINTKLEAIGNYTHAMYGGQRPSWELQEDTKRSVDHLVTQTEKNGDFLKRIGTLLSRPGKSDVEANLTHTLGSVIFEGLGDEARTAALEGESLFMRQEERFNHGVIVEQFAIAFECQLREKIAEPFLRQQRKPNDRISLADMHRMFEYVPRDFKTFVEEAGFNFELVREKIGKVIPFRNNVAHRVEVSEQKARRLRHEWLGVYPRGGGIFAPLVPNKVVNVRPEQMVSAPRTIKIDPEKHGMPGKPPVQS